MRNWSLGIGELDFLFYLLVVVRFKKKHNMLGNIMAGVTPLVTVGFGVLLAGPISFYQVSIRGSVLDSQGRRLNLSYGTTSFCPLFYFARGGDERLPAATFRFLSSHAECGADNEGERARG